MHRNEGDTLLGLGWLQWALVLDLVLMGIAFASAVSIVPAFFHALGAGQDPAMMGPAVASEAGVLAASIVLGIGILVLSVAGIASVRTDLHGHGEAHARLARYSLPFLLAAILAFLSHIALPREAAMIVGIPEEVLAVPDWAIPLRILLCGLVALFGGLAVYCSTAGLARGRILLRLRLATGLGVMSAVAGAVFGVAGFGETNVDAYVTVIKAHSIAGEGVAIISLLLFILALRELRKDIMAREPAEVSVAPASAASSPPGAA